MTTQRSATPWWEDEMERQDRIAAYAEGELSGTDRREFEDRLARDKKLAVELAAWRGALAAGAAWVAEEPPGLARAGELAIPPLPEAVKRDELVSAAPPPPRRAYWLRYAAAAALFVAGFGLGRSSQVTAPSSAPKVASPTVTPPDQAAPKVEAEPSNEELKSPLATAPQEREVANAPSIRRVEDEHGRLIIETTLQGSGGRAVWVVDGGFRLDPANPRP